MSKNNVRIAIRDSTDSHNVAFFDNKAGIKYKSANLHRFLAGSASILTIKYNSKDIDSIRSGCKLAFRYKARDYWLNVMSFEKKGFEVELTAYSLGLELNNETRGEHKPANAMSIAEYVAYYDPEHALTIGVNEVSDKQIKLEWTGTDTILARLFSVANSFGAELDFNVELNDDYSLKRQVLNIYKKGNLGTNKVSQPVRVGKELKVINYSDNIKELRTAVRATGKDGLTIDGLNKKIYDNNKELLYYSSGMTVYAPQSRDRFPSVGKGSNDNWIVEDLGETQYETKEALWGYMYGEIQKKSLPEITYEVEGAIEAGIGDTQTLIDGIHFEPALYVQARVSELEDDILTGKVTKSTFINFERKYSQIADSLLKQVEALAEDAAPYIVRLSTDNGYNFKNGQGSSTITAKLEKYSKIVNADWKWLINNSIVSETSSVTINASQVVGTLNVVAVATVDGNEVAREYITFTNSDDGVGIKSIKRYYTTNDQAEGVTAGGQNWSTKPTTVTADKNYMWSYDVITYTNDTSLVTEPAVIGARGDDGLDADTTGITEALDKAKQELTALSANIEKVRDDSLAAVNEAKQQLAAVADDLSKAKTDLQNAVSAVDTKATNLQTDLTKAKQDLTNQASQLQAQAAAQADLTSRVSTVEETANGTKTTVSELSKTVASNTNNITSVSNRTKTVEDDLTSTKTTLSQVQTTANSASQKTATLETGLNGLNAKFDSLSVGNKNYLPASRVVNRGCSNFKYNESSKSWTMTVPAGATGFGKGITFNIANLDVRLFSEETLYFGMLIKADKACKFVYDINNWLSPSGSNSNDNDDRSKAKNSNLNIPAGAWTKVWFSYTAKPNTVIVDSNSTCGITDNKEDVNLEIKDIMVAKSNVPVDYQMPDADIEQKVAEYKQTADQNYASLQTTVQNLDETVQQNKTTAEQTAAGFKTRIESLETYKNSENIRANQYFESAKTETARQLTAERTAIAKDYVAKSTYTSDVTGIRNDLSATTTTANATKTNLANYQASNDKAVANLQSNLQTANGNISSLQTKIEAVPGQITSAVSAVESKIPTSVGSTNLLLYSADPSKAPSGYYDFTSAQKTSETYNGSVVYKTQGIWSGIRVNLGNLVDRGLLKVGDVLTYSIAMRAEQKTPIQARLFIRYTNQSAADSPTNKIEIVNLTTNWQYVSITFTVTAKMLAENTKVTYLGWELTSNAETDKYVYYACNKIERGNIATDWSPAPEDTVSQISSLSSQIKQTADGMTLLATKTELNTVKSDLQSGITTATSKADNAQATANSNAQTISTHTTQISALNTGLSAKVSQTDFNTLSGRVSTAENNITAKANELRSEISSVENKIPDSIAGSNLYVISKASKGFISVYSEELGAQTGNNEYTSDFIPVSANDKYIFQGWVTVPENGYPWHRYHYYDADKHKIGNPIMFESTIPLTGEQHYAEHITVPSNANIAYIRISARLYNDGKLKFERGNVATDYSLAPEDLVTTNALSTAKSEIKQTTDSISASVSSVQATASNAQSTANTAVSKADAAQAGVNTLDSTTVKTATLNLDNNGFVTKVGKTVNGNTFATMIAQNESDVQIIAKKMKVSGDMIVNGAITAEKLNVSNLSAVNSNLGKIKGGSLLLQENKAASSSIDSWGTFNRPAHKQGLYMDNHGLVSSGAIQRKNGGETTPTDMPIAVLQSGELRFLVVDYNDNLENVLHYGLSDPDFGAIRFEIDSELKRRLTMTSSGYLNFQATNYTNWTSTGVSGCEYMIQGRLVLVNYDVTFNSAGTHTIGGIPQEFTKKSLMMTAKAWTITPRDKNIQLNSDGTLHILDAEANVNYRGTLVFSY